MANLLQFNHSPLDYQHRSNIQSSLARRIELARAANNVQLLELLEQEKRQLGLSSEHASRIKQWGEQIACFWKELGRIVFPGNTLRVEQVVDASGGRWWYAYDPETGDSVYADSETELNLWLKDRF